MPPISPVASSIARVERVAINGRGGRVHPQARRICEAGEGLMQQPRGADARIVKFAAVARRRTAIDAAAGEMDADVGAFERFHPRAERLAVPVHGGPGCRVGAAREHRDVVAALLKKPRQHAAHLAAAAGKHDAQGTAVLFAGIAHGISLTRHAAGCASRCYGNWL